jgi:hypothetical protein
MKHPEIALRKPRIAIISGHINILHSKFAIYYYSPLNKAIAKGNLFILGDAKGTDEMALDYILERDSAVYITIYILRAHRVQEFQDKNIQVVFIEAIQKGASGSQKHLQRDTEIMNASDYNIL